MLYINKGIANITSKKPIIYLLNLSPSHFEDFIHFSNIIVIFALFILEFTLLFVALFTVLSTLIMLADLSKATKNLKYKFIKDIQAKLDFKSTWHLTVVYLTSFALPAMVLYIFTIGIFCFDKNIYKIIHLTTYYSNQNLICKNIPKTAYINLLDDNMVSISPYTSNFYLKDDRIHFEKKICAMDIIQNS